MSVQVSSAGVSVEGEAAVLSKAPSPDRILHPLRLAARHWLAIANTAVAVFVSLSFVAPLLMASGWTDAALTLYTAYGFTCHQWPFRSFFLLGPQPTYSFEALVSALGTSHVHDVIGSAELGYKMAFCERDLGIYTAILLAGLGYALIRRSLRPASVSVYVLLCLPIAVDGFTQLFGWRESTWELRLVTGSIFGLANVWFVYPRFERFLSESRLVPREATARDHGE